MTGMTQDPNLKGTPYELFFVLLSLLSIANLGIVLFANGVARDVSLLMEVVITPLFAIDAAYRLVTSPARRAYVVRDGGWADLLAVLPLLRVFRLLRVRRVARELRNAGSERVL